MLLKEKQVAAILRLKPGTLRAYRCRSKAGEALGPKWIKLNGAIRYDDADLKAYIESRKVNGARGE